MGLEHTGKRDQPAHPPPPRILTQNLTEPRGARGSSARCRALALPPSRAQRGRRLSTPRTNSYPKDRRGDCHPPDEPTTGDGYLGCSRQLADALAALSIALSPDEVAQLEREVPASAVSGTRYAENLMAYLDSERG